MIEEFLLLFKQAELASEQMDSVHQFEPFFVQLASYIECYPQSKEEFESIFCETLSKSSIPWELIAFCMHKFRWPRVLKEAKSLLMTNEDPRVKSMLSSVIQAYKVDWEDAEMYHYYSQYNDGTIASGYDRTEAARKAGIEKIPAKEQQVNAEQAEKLDSEAREAAAERALRQQ